MKETTMNEVISLMRLVDEANQNMLLGTTVFADEKLSVARWISSRQGKENAYRGMFAPTAYDMQEGIHLFTGEKLTSASARHCLGQQAARVAWLYGSNNPDIRDSYERAVAWMRDHEHYAATGTFCCGRCTVAFWHHYWTGDFENKEESLVKGLEVLKSERDGSGKWRRFPFYYTVYVLKDIDLPKARNELAYTRPLMERYLKSNHPGTFTDRRKVVFQQALDLVS